MKLTLTATDVVDTIEGKTQARIWEGVTEGGVPVKAWIALVQPQTHDPELHKQFEAELRDMQATRRLVSFDMRIL